jgi:hypothetical protein
MPRFQPAAEQAAHPKSGPRRRPRELPGSVVTQRDFGRTTHINCSPIFPARFKTTEMVLLLSADVEPIEVVRPQIAERQLVAEDVKRNHQDRVRDGDRRTFGPRRLAMRRYCAWR